MEGAYSKLTFTNTYIKNNIATDPTDPILSISKTVDGAYGNREMYFAFNLTVNRAALVAEGTKYKVYVMEGTTAVTSAENTAAEIKTDGEGRKYFEVTADTATAINLKHGQKLAFVDTHVGTTYTMTEVGKADYKPSVSIIANGAAAVVINDKDFGDSLSTGARLIGENANSAAFTNTYKEVTPTGISLNNLPFIMMIALAGILLVVYVVVRYRKRALSN